MVQSCTVNLLLGDVMKSFAYVAALGLLAAASPAAAVFTLNNDLGGDGFVVVKSPTVFTLFSANDGTDNNVTTFGEIAAATTTITGKFRYATADVDGSTFDPAGYFINGIFTQLSVDSIARPATQIGTFSFTVNAGDSYGFYVSTTDGALGRGALTVGAVPEPASWAMLIAGFGLVGAAARRRRRAVAA
jgi:hypothetical protein